MEVTERSSEYLDYSQLILARPDHMVLDSTKLKAYATCPRQYFWRYVVGWDRDPGSDSPPTNHLIFGEAWHAAMKALLDQVPYNPDSVVGAYEAFLTTYRRTISPNWDDLYEPKTPEMALNALIEYVKTYQTDRFRVLYTEVTGSVPIEVDRVVHFRLDAVVETNDGIVLLEHKTTGRLDSRWARQWTLDIQVNLYLHAMHCLYPECRVDGALVNGAGFAKTGPTFMRVPVRRTGAAMTGWVQTENDLLDRLEQDVDRLAYATLKDLALDCFHMNPGSCGDWYGCQFHDLCLAYPNSLLLLDRVGGRPPVGFTMSPWNPREAELRSAESEESHG